jgi:uncharacterized membrane-anchored protein YhcB (DUF1043 family)
LGVYTQKYEQLITADGESAKAWSQFLEQMMLSQENTQLAIEAQIQQEKTNIDEIEKKLIEHCKKTTKLWSTFTACLPEVKRASLGNTVPEFKKPQELEAWLQTMKELHQKNTYQVDVIEKRTVKIHERYSAVTAGRTNILKYPGAFTPNLLAWWKGTGKLFPNLQAWWSGELDLKSIFPIANNF